MKKRKVLSLCLLTAMVLQAVSGSAGMQQVQAAEVVEKQSRDNPIYTTDAPLTLLANGVNNIEAESFELDASGVVVADKYVRITEKDTASNGQEVNWFENGNKIKLAFIAEEAGTYEVKATYRSGRAEGSPNAFEWSGTNVTSGFLDVWGPDATVFKTAEFNIEITEPGEGQLVFTASSKAGPVIDKFVITRVDASNIRVNTISLTPANARIGVGESLPVSAEVLPANAANKAVTYSSGNTEVATVNADGTITGVSAGSTVITATASDGSGVTGTCEVTVLPSGDMVTDADLENNDTVAPAPDDVLPSPEQYRYQKEELAAFCHFGMNTFTGLEWGSGKESPSQFTLTTPIEADTYVKSLKDAGFGKLIVTAKHHDSFCIWRSAYTDHDLDSTGYPGDVLEELSAACTKYDMDMGLYLSPWDENNDSYGYYDANGNPLCNSNGQPLDGMTWEQVEELDVLDYNEYYDNQLTEILGNDKYGNNGKFVEVWMDGAKGGGADTQNYDFQRWFTTIQKYEGLAAGRDSDCMLFGAEAYTTVRWIGNENGFAHEETWSKSKVNYDNNTIDSRGTGGYTQGWADGNQWTVPEADARITSGWFWGNNKKTPKSIEDLAEMYFRSVGHNAPLLLNIPLNNQGGVDQAILDRTAEFGEAIRDSFQTNYAASQGASISVSSVRGNAKKYSPANLTDGDDTSYWTLNDGETTGIIEIDLGRERTIDVISIEESIEFGQRINSFFAEYKNKDGEWTTFGDEEETRTTIGAKRLLKGEAVKTEKVRITIGGTANGKVPMLNEVGVYKAAEGFGEVSAMPECMKVIDNTDTDVTDGDGFIYDGWAQEENAQMMGGTGMWKNGGEFTFNFTGSKVYIYGTVDPAHGTADVYIDNVKVKSIDTEGENRAINQVIFESDSLEHGAHVLRMTGTNGKAIGIQAAAVIDNGGRGMFEFAEKNYRVTEGVDDYAELTIRRVGGSQGEVKVNIQVNPGSAMQADFDADANQTLTFAEGETEKTIRIAIWQNDGDDEREEEDFTVELLPVSGEGVETAIGFTRVARVVIYESQTEEAQEVQALLKEAKLYKEEECTEGYEGMRSVVAEAKAVLSNKEATAEQMNAAIQALRTALQNVVVSVREFSMTPESLILEKVGDKAQLTVHVLPEHATNKAVSFTSSNPEVAAVDTKGMITAVKAGTAVITATTEAGNFTRKCTVTVKASAQEENPAPQVTVPAQVTGVVASANKATSLKLTWNQVSGGVSYTVESYNVSQKTWTVVGADITAANYTIKGLKAGTVYRYRVKAVNAAGSGTYSSELQTVTAPKKPVFSSVKVSRETRKAKLKWKKNTSVSGYQIYMKIGNKKYKRIKNIKKAKTTSYVKTKLKAGTKYSFKIRAYKKAGKTTAYSAFSKVKKVTIQK